MKIQSVKQRKDGKYEVVLGFNLDRDPVHLRKVLTAEKLAEIQNKERSQALLASNN